jgi:type IV pilus assembly protein PilW
MNRTQQLLSGRQHGFTLVELMIAILISVFLVGGLMTMVQSNRRSFYSQNQLAQLQDGERLAMSMITDIVQIAGYFPDPTTYTAQSTMPAITTPVTMGSGQYVFGTEGSAAPALGGDTIYIQFATKPSDGILNCSGKSNSTGVSPPFLNEFYVATTGTFSGYLVCNMNGTDFPMVSGVRNMQVTYGINSAGTGNNVDEYLNATGMTGNWNKVISVVITLTFNNPLYTTATAGTGQPQYLSVTRNISVMNQVGL